MNGGPRVSIDPAVGVIDNLTEFGNDVATLVELQAKLAALDLEETRRRATVPVVMLAVGVWVALGVVPVLLFGLAELLVLYAGLKLAWALLLVAGVTLAAVGAVAWFAIPAISRSMVSFRRSREELMRNISWVRTVLVYSGRGKNRRN